MAELAVKKLMERLPDAFISEKSAGINAVIQLHITGEGGGDWVLTIQNKTCRLQDGIAANPNLVLEGDTANIIDIFTGKLDGMRAFMQGKLVLRGDIGMAMRLVKLFRAA